MPGGLVHGARAFGGGGGFIESRPHFFKRRQHVGGFELQGRSAIDDRLDAAFGRLFHLLGQI